VLPLTWIITLQKKTEGEETITVLKKTEKEEITDSRISCEYEVYI
jgi:hypothetical protein